MRSEALDPAGGKLGDQRGVEKTWTNVGELCDRFGSYYNSHCGDDGGVARMQPRTSKVVTDLLLPQSFASERDVIRSVLMNPPQKISGRAWVGSVTNETQAFHDV